ncbi:MAG TPA: carboxymuconolactone decarboxylase family protein [Polyangiaceae bacterium]|nr:carboxymuconolactone decarboxylase family protein [Polyangiaceae bacterium]
MTSALLTPFSSEHGALPLAPVDQPKNPFVRVLYGAMRRRYGQVPTAFRVMYARSPFVGFVALVLALGLMRFLRIGRELTFLLQSAIAMQNGCTFCADLQLAEAVRARMGRERFRELGDFASSDSFSPREKAALAYAHALQRSLHVPDAVWQGLSRHFSERERVDIVWVCAVERYFNAMALPLRIGSDHLADR